MIVFELNDCKLMTRPTGDETGDETGINRSHFRQLYELLHEYQSNQKPISALLERLTPSFQANNFSEEKRLAVFLSIVGATMYSILRDRLAPQSHRRSLSKIFSLL